jgi:hypothetical protein
VPTRTERHGRFAVADAAGTRGARRLAAASCGRVEHGRRQQLLARTLVRAVSRPAAARRLGTQALRAYFYVVLWMAIRRAAAAGAGSHAAVPGC